MPTSNITASVETVTPKMAAEWLSRNVVNRNMNRHHVQSLAEVMRRGEWHLNGQSISFDAEGSLQDGQHRLAAVVKSKCTVQMLVVRGVDVEARPTVDTGRKRTVADELTMHGEKNATALSAVLMMVRRIDIIQGRGANVVLTSIQALEMLEDDPSYRQAVSMAEPLRQFVPLPASVLGYTTHKFLAISKHDTVQFWEPFQTGVFAGAGDPRFVLQRTLNKLAADRGFSTGMFTNKVILAALVIRAWNAYREGRELHHLRHQKNDDFPRAH